MDGRGKEKEGKNQRRGSCSKGLLDRRPDYRHIQIRTHSTESATLRPQTSDRTTPADTCHSSCLLEPCTGRVGGPARAGPPETAFSPGRAGPGRAEKSTGRAEPGLEMPAKVLRHKYSHSTALV